MVAHLIGRKEIPIFPTYNPLLEKLVEPACLRDSQSWIPEAQKKRRLKIITITFLGQSDKCSKFRENVFGGKFSPQNICC